MTRREWGISLVAGAVIVAGAAVLVSWRSWQKLGRPGVRLVAEPFPCLDRSVGGTNRVIYVGTNHVDLPALVPPYQSRLMPLERVVWEALPPDTTFGQRHYEAPDGFGIRNLVVLMGTDRTSIHQPQYCLTGAGWTIVSSEKTSVRVQRPQPYDLPVMKLIPRRRLKDAEGRVLDSSGVFLYWFVADGQLSNDHKERMWWLARDLLLKGTLQRWAYVICFAPCPPGQEDATFARLKEFVAASVPEYHLATRGWLQ